MPITPPTGHPPILLTSDYRSGSLPKEQQPRPNVVVRDHRLRMYANQPHTNEGFAAGMTPFRDIIVQAQLALRAGDDNDMYGLFVRQSSEQTYYTFTMSPRGHCVVAQYAAQYLPIANGTLAPDMVFYQGLDTPNLFQIVACGPCLTFILNNMVVTGVMVDPRFQEGYLGFFLHHGASSAQAELAADWIQVRAIFPDQQGWGDQ